MIRLNPEHYKVLLRQAYWHQTRFLLTLKVPPNLTLLKTKLLKIIPLLIKMVCSKVFHISIISHRMKPMFSKSSIKLISWLKMKLNIFKGDISCLGKSMNSNQFKLKMHRLKNYQVSLKFNKRWRLSTTLCQFSQLRNPKVYKRRAADPRNHSLRLIIQSKSVKRLVSF